jgi:hypothetical protein
MKPSSLIALAILLAIPPAWVSAESILNKCTDGKQITYTDKPCEKLGLKGAGPIKDTVTIVTVSSKPEVPLNKSHEDDAPKAETNGPIKLLLDKFLN